MADRETFGFTINDVARMTRTCFERRIAAADLGVTTAEARALTYIATLGETRQNRIAERMNVEPMTASRVIDRLAERGLLERRQDPDDRRANLVSVTQAAEGLISAIWREGAALRDEMLAGVGEKEREIMMKVLRMVQGNLQTMVCRSEDKVPA